MKAMILSGAAGLMLAGAAHAASPFDGTWKTDLSTIDYSKRPNVHLLKDGVYTCSSCVPPISVKADGAFHPVTGHPGLDEMAIKVVNASTVEETDRAGGRVVSHGTVTASADGKTVTATFTDTTNAGAPPVTGTSTVTRTAPAPAGAHATSGTFVMTRSAGVSDAGLLITFKLEGDILHMSTPTGASYAAKLGGGEAPVKGDPTVTTVSLKKVSDHELVETDSFKGKPVFTYDMTVSPDGKSITTKVENKKTGSKSAYTAKKV